MAEVIQPAAHVVSSAYIQGSETTDSSARPPTRWPHVRVKPILGPPGWAGAHGDWLVSSTRRKFAQGFTSSRETGLDPLAVLTELLSDKGSSVRHPLYLP